MRYSVDSDISAARTLDRDFYRDEAAFGLARERVFARTWQWLGRLDDVAASGSLAPRDLLPGLLDEPLLLSRDAAGTLRCLSNVCTHRGNVLVHAPCGHEAAPVLTCSACGEALDPRDMRPEPGPGAHPPTPAASV